MCVSPKIYFYYIPLTEQLKPFFLQEHIYIQMVFDAVESATRSERWTGDVFKEYCEKAKEIGCKMAFLEYFSDGTQVSSFGNHSVHPIQLTLGNLPYHAQNSKGGTIFVGVFPNFDEYPTIQDSLQKLQIMHNCWYAFTEDIKQCLLEEKPLELPLYNNTNTKLLPFIGLWRGDTPEIKKLNVIKDINTGKGEAPCSMCVVPGSHFQDEQLFSHRKKEDTVSILEKQDAEEMKRLAYIPSVKVVYHNYH